MRTSIAVVTLGMMAFISLSLLSCQPEVQPYTPQTDSTGSLLYYVTGHTNGGDSFYVSYQYDAQKRWVGNRILALSGGDTSKLKLIVTRDAAGYVTSIIGVDSSDISAISIDTTKVLHNAAGRYTISYYSTNNSNGYADTTEYIYDSNGRIIRTQDRSHTLSDTIYSHYTGSNLDSLIYRSGVISTFSGLVLKYDTKMAPSNLGNEAFLLELPFLYGTGNVISYTSVENGNITGQGVISYTFNTANRPTKAIAIVLPANDQYTAYYHYQ